MAPRIHVQGLFSKLSNFVGTKIKNNNLTGALFKTRDNYKG
jgi:hypothetical protein